MVIQCLGCGKFFKGRSEHKVEVEYNQHLLTCPALMDIDKLSDAEVLKLAKMISQK